MAVASLRYNHESKLENDKGQIVYDGKPSAFFDWEFKVGLKNQQIKNEKDTGKKMKMITQIIEGLKGDALHVAVMSGNFDVTQIVGEIRAQDAGAMDETDKQLILGLIQDAMGMDCFNIEMRERLLECMKLTVAAVIARGGARGRLQRQTMLSKRSRGESPRREGRS